MTPAATIRSGAQTDEEKEKSLQEKFTDVKETKQDKTSSDVKMLIILIKDRLVVFDDQSPRGDGDGVCASFLFVKGLT